MNLQQELNRQVPFASTQQEAILNLLRTSDQLENRLSRFFRQHELTLSQFNLLRVLQIEGRKLKCSEIKQRMIQVVPAITGLVDRLEQQGLVTRSQSPEDRRVVFVGITAAGIALCEAAMQPLLDLEQSLLADLSCGELRDAIRLMQKIRSSLAKESSQASG